MRFAWKEKETWAPLVAKTKGRRQTPASILKFVRATYDSFTVFHAARPVDVNSYYREGLRLANHAELTKIARGIFLSKEFPEIDEAAFARSVSRLNGIDDQKSYVTLDDRCYLTDTGHYLIYGSEHICGIAAGLHGCEFQDYRQVLKRFGKPTIFKLSIPLSIFDDSDMLEFAELLREWISRVRSGRRPCQVDFTFLIRENLQPDCIIGHEHPAVVTDPLLPMKPEYRYGA